MFLNKFTDSKNQLKLLLNRVYNLENEVSQKTIIKPEIELMFYVESILILLCYYNTEKKFIVNLQDIYYPYSNTLIKNNIYYKIYAKKITDILKNDFKLNVEYILEYYNTTIISADIKITL